MCTPSDLMIYISLFYSVTIFTQASGLKLVAPVLNFYKTRHINSVQAFSCDYSGGRQILDTTTNQKEAKYLTNVKVGGVSSAKILLRKLTLQSHRIGILIDMNCQSSWDLLRIASEEQLFNTSYVFALVFDEPLVAALPLLDPVQFQFDSDVTLFGGSKLLDVHRTSATKPPVLIPCGTASETLVSHTKPPRWDMDGGTIKATTVIKEFKWKEDGVEKFLNPSYHPEVDALSRFALVAHQYVEFLCNFKTNLTTAPDWGYYRPETGKFDPESMYGRLEQGKVDLGLTLSRQISGRLSASFLAPSVRVVKTSVVFRHPPAGATYFGFARPFTLNTWLVTFTYIFVSSLVLSAIRRPRIYDDPPNEPELSSSLFNVIAILSLQGSYIDSLRIPTRVLSAVLHFFGLMVYSYYAAEIVGFLLSPSPRTLTTVDKLLESRMDLWMENVSFHRNHYAARLSPKLTKYYEVAIKGPTRDKDKFMDRAKAMKRVQKGGVALYGQSTDMFRVIEDTFSGPEVCAVHNMEIMAVPTAIAVRKKAPYREMYYKALSRFLESGFKDYEDKKWHARKPPCFGGEETAPVKLEATLIAQLIFVGGLAFAILLFLVEKLQPPKNTKITNERIIFY